MNGAALGSAGTDLANKIARLVEERGWNQEDFARISKLNRHTVRQILHGGPKRSLRNATISQCADALGVTVRELRTMPLERLLPRMHGKPPADEEALKLLYERSALPDLISWLERNKDRAALFHPEEVQEILEGQAPGGVLDKGGVESFVDVMERRRTITCQVREIVHTEYLTLLEQFVRLVYEKVKPRSR